ncbi:hypothetical protein WJX74_003801 [Apatococcus lobatus]|uniref:Phytanoyl-CoA dioxygenase family protein n=2 Tax=Apatococcus TaxID=904362 RepID=A0AAW1T1X8_9CHLO
MHTLAKEARQALEIQGFAVIPSLLDARSLDIVCAECERILETRCTCSQSTISQQLLNRGCILETCPEAASCSEASFASIRQAWPLSRSASAMLTAGELSGLACALFGSQAYLYNDQYIVKPPRSHSSGFAWHHDSQWLPDNAAYYPYISIWVALDDVDEDNGCLHILPKWRQPQTSPRDSAEHALPSESIVMSLTAGDAVVMTDKLWHCSGPNRSSHFRRAWMPQFSTQPITCQILKRPIALAIPVQ